MDKKLLPGATMDKCENTRMNTWCNNQDLKLVQMRSQTTGVSGKNEFNGETLVMCKECRKSHTGQIKLVKD